MKQKKKISNKGLGFFPTPNNDFFRLKMEVTEFLRKIRLRVFFYNVRTDDLEDKNTDLWNKSHLSQQHKIWPWRAGIWTGREPGTGQIEEKEAISKYHWWGREALQSLSVDP